MKLRFPEKRPVRRNAALARRGLVLLSVLPLALILPGCKRRAVEPHLLSVVEMSNPQAATQLLSGFYPTEAGAWRWTRQSFSVLLATPPGVSQSGAWLWARVTAPDSLISAVGTVTLAASCNGQPLPPEGYESAGTYTYGRAVPASALQGKSVRVDFTLDKVMPPSKADIRDLGIVVLAVGLGRR